jgi:hypothetical protein
VFREFAKRRAAWAAEDAYRWAFHIDESMQMEQHLERQLTKLVVDQVVRESVKRWAAWAAEDAYR